MAYRIKINKKNILWPIKILKYCLPLLSFGFFGQIFLMFTTIFYCLEDELKASPYLKCRPGHWFNKLKIVGAIAMFLHLLIALITNKLYYKLIFIPNGSDLLKKSHSFPDIFFLFTKIIIITLFILDKGVESEHWYILSFLIILTGINAYLNIYYKNRQNKMLSSVNNFFCLILFFGFLVLFIGNIFKYLNFNGGIFLFFCSVIIIIIYSIFYKNDEMDFIIKDFKTINNIDEFLKYLNSFYNLIKNKNNSRNDAAIIKSLITSIELNCLEQNCLLKKYLINLEKGFDFEYLLFQFYEKIIQYGIHKFNGNYDIKIIYGLFLALEMNNKKKASMILEKIKEEITSLEQNYNIYRCQKIIENYSPSYIKKNSSISLHRINISEFKINIEKAVFLYYEFFSLLLKCKIQSINNFEKINEIGYNIKKINRMLENTFNDIINSKTDNLEIINLYSEFVENILKDEMKLEKCQFLKKISYNNNSLTDIHEKDYSNYDLEILKDNCNLHYLVISAENKNLGMILDCPNSLSNILGYLKSELINEYIDILIPEIYREKHKKVLSEKTEEFRLPFLQGFYKKTNYSPIFLEKDIYCITKSRLLLPLALKIYLARTEENHLVYIAEIKNNFYFHYDLLKKLDEESPNFCILTDKNLIIQSFTPNCINFLNINYEDINSNINIMKYIKQFREDYLTAIKMTLLCKFTQINKTGMFSLRNTKLPNKNSSKKNISYRRKQKIKKDLFNKKYLKKCIITWTNNYGDNNHLNSTKIEQNNCNRFKNSSLINIDSNIFEENFNVHQQFEIDLYMETKHIIMDNESIGYYFCFSKINNNENKRYLSCKIISREKQSSKNIEKFKKYQVFIKPQNFIYSNNKTLTSIFKPEIIQSLTKKADVKVKFKEEKKNNEKRGSKYSSSKTIKEINKDEDIIVNESFIPISQVNFKFNLPNISYDYSMEIEDKDSYLNHLLKKEAYDKINKFKSTQCIQFKKDKSSSNVSSSYRSASSFDGYEQEVLSTYSKSLNEKKNERDKLKALKNNSCQTIGDKLGELNEDLKNNNEKNQNLKNKNDLISGYYTVNINKIILMIYDFDKETIIEDKKKDNYIPKVESIINEYKKQYTINPSENYPLLLIKRNEKEEEKKIKLEKKESKGIKETKTAKSKKPTNNKDKMLIRKIHDAINNHQDEKPIKKLKILTISFFIFLLCVVSIAFLYFLIFYSSIKELYSLIKNSLYMKNANLISIYYIRELTLLNIRLEGINRSEYLKFPDKKKEKYISLIEEYLIDLFKISQTLMKKIFSTSLSMSVNSTKFINNTKFNIELLGFNYSSGYTYSDIYTSLMQYNNAFYNIVFGKIYYEFQNDIIDFIYNSFNNYGKLFNLLINIYNYELESQEKKLKKILIIFLIILFLIFIIIHILSIKYFRASNLMRINYIEVFYSINENILRIEVGNCLKLIKKYETSKNKLKNYSDDNEEQENSLEDQGKNIKYNYYNIYDNQNNNNEYNSNEKALSYVNRLFFIFSGFFMIFIYGYFILTSIYTYKLLQKKIKMSHFSNNILTFHFNIFETYNAYREFLFDNQSIISNLNSYEYLILKEKEIYQSLTQLIKNTNKTLIEVVDSNPKYLQAINKHYCSFIETDYFNSFEECINKFGNILTLDFYNFMGYFLEQIRIRKNIVKYLLENEIIIGNLTKFDKKDMNIISEMINNTNAIFRLDLFNDEKLHADLNELYFNIILPYLKSISNIFRSFGEKDEDLFYFVLSFILFIIILSIIIYFCYFHLINYFNKQIYKTKNMLSIIPIHFLLYNSNIKTFIRLLTNDI